MSCKGRLFLEMITAGPSEESYFINVSLVYGKALADLQPELIINTAKSSWRQHGAGKNEGAALGALMAFPLPHGQLSLYVSLSEVD